MYIFAPKRHRKLNNSIFKNAEDLQAQKYFFLVFRLCDCSLYYKVQNVFQKHIFQTWCKNGRENGFIF